LLARSKLVGTANMRDFVG